MGSIVSSDSDADGGSSEARTELDCGAPGGLFLATHKGQTEAVKHLLDNGTDVNLKDEAGLTCLSLACSLPKEHIEIVQLLLKYDAEVNTSGRPPLTAATMKGHIEVINLLLNSGADVNIVDMIGCFPLVWASVRENPMALNDHLQKVAMVEEAMVEEQIITSDNYIAVLNLLLDHGAQVNMQVDNGASALHAASKMGNTETVKLLLNRGAKVNMLGTTEHHSRIEFSALMIASFNGHTEVVRVLLEAGADVNLCGQHGWSPLDAACTTERAETTKFLVELAVDKEVSIDSVQFQFNSEVIELLCHHGAEINERHLFLSILYGHTETVRQLLLHRAQFDGDSSPLGIAIFAGRAEIVQLLLSNNAPVQPDDVILSIFMQRIEIVKTIFYAMLESPAEYVDYSDYKTLENFLCVFSRSEGRSEILKRLLNCCPVPSNALPATSALGLTETAKILLDHGAKVNLQDANGVSALMEACSGGHPEVVKLLLEHGAKVNALDSKGNSALIYASSMENPFFAKNDEEAALLRGIVEKYVEIVRVLLDNGAEADAKNNEGMSAQLAACSNGDIDILRLLLSHGSQVDPRGIEIARQKAGNHIEIIELLNRKGGGGTLPVHDKLDVLEIQKQMKEMKEEMKEEISRANGGWEAKD
jgi:serine/threonine-protein phosphatase 6 regulatory ankyrin repeat subunit B